MIGGRKLALFLWYQMKGQPSVLSITHSTMSTHGTVPDLWTMCISCLLKDWNGDYSHWSLTARDYSIMDNALYIYIIVHYHYTASRNPF
jgi:hypothetical protein